MPDDTTTIQLTTATKQRLDAVKLDGESYDDAVRRLVDDEGVLFTESEIRELIREELRDAANGVGP